MCVCVSHTHKIYQYSPNTNHKRTVSLSIWTLSHTQTHTQLLSLSPLTGSGRGKSKHKLHCMFVYVNLPVILVAAQLRAVSIRKARPFKDNYEPCEQAAQLQHTLGPDRTIDSSCVSGFITQGRPGGFGDERDSMIDKQSHQTSEPGSLWRLRCLAEDSTSQPLCLFA